MVKSKKGRLGICCYGRSEMEYLVPLFCRYFDKYLEIVPLEEKDLIHLRTLEDVPDVILTTYITYDSVRAHFPHKKVLTMKRFLTGQNVESVIRLPEGTKALVVNWPERAAQEVVRELELQGIHHIHMTPYWPDSNIKISDYSAVIYTGSSYFPKGDFQYINLGHRTVALSTLIEIIQEFNLPAVCGEQFYYDNVERIIHGSFRLNRLLNATQEMRSNIERICDLNKNAVFAYDENEKITYFNPAAEKLFQIQNRRELLHRPLKTVLREYGGLVSQLLSKKAIEEMMVKIHGAEALVTTSVYETENGPNTMVNIMLLEDFQQAASNARSKLKTRDFIAKYRFDNILGDSSEILQAVKIAKTYAYSDATVLITGESGVGKSETAIELVKRGHRLIADDAVEIKKVSPHELVGSAPPVLKHYIELRGIGVINVAKLFGMGAVKESSNIDLIINMVPWRDGEAYDRLGMETQYTEILDVKVPSITVPITPGRNLAVIFEVAAMNNRQKRMGYNAAVEFTEQMSKYFTSRNDD